MIGSPFWNRMPVTGSQSHGLLSLSWNQVRPLLYSSLSLLWAEPWFPLPSSSSFSFLNLVSVAAAREEKVYRWNKDPVSSRQKKRKGKKKNVGWKDP